MNFYYPGCHSMQPWQYRNPLVRFYCDGELGPHKEEAYAVKLADGRVINLFKWGDSYGGRIHRLTLYTNFGHMSTLYERSSGWTVEGLKQVELLQNILTIVKQDGAKTKVSGILAHCLSMTNHVEETGMWVGYVHRIDDDYLISVGGYTIHIRCEGKELTGRLVRSRDFDEHEIKKQDPQARIIMQAALHDMKGDENHMIQEGQSALQELWKQLEL